MLLNLVKEHWASAATAALVSLVTLISAIATGVTRPHAYTSVQAKLDEARVKEWTREYIRTHVPPDKVVYRLDDIDGHLERMAEVVSRIEDRVNVLSIDLATVKTHSHPEDHIHHPFGYDYSKPIPNNGKQ